MKIAILDGSAHSGKTTVLQELSRRGYLTIEEAETPLVRRWVNKYGPNALKDCLHDSKGVLIPENYTRFKALVGVNQARLIREMAKVAGKDEIVFQDRSAIGWIAYCKLRNADVPLILEELSKKQRAEYVFFHENIPFNERKETGRFMVEEEAKKLEELIRKEYEIRGYRLIEVPAYYNTSLDESVNKRVEFILSKIQND